MKTLRSIGLIALYLLTICCEEEKIFAPNSISDLLGDKDGFGIGLKDGDAWTPGPPGTQLPIDYRKNDPHFTDIYPADLGMGFPSDRTFSYIHEFDLAGREITSAKFIFTTLGIQDGDSQVFGSDTGIKLFVDGIEIPGALDHVDQFDKVEGIWSSLVGTIEVEIPANIWPSFTDGLIEVKWKILQMNPNSQSYDAFAIDYSELEVMVSDPA
jgi:hypothetical protein